MGGHYQSLTLLESLGDMEVFRFLELPAEIRIQIYSLLLTTTAPPGSLSTRNRPEVDASLLRVSRKIHSECTSLLYSKNIFHAHPARLTSMPYLWDIGRPVLSPGCCRLIRRYYIEVRLDNDIPWGVDDCAKAFGGVEELHIVAWQASYGICGVQNLVPFTKVRGVGRARVEGTSVPPALARWLEGLMQREDNETDGSLVSGPPDVSMEEWNLWDHCNR